jgi:hypothetical protein
MSDKLFSLSLVAARAAGLFTSHESTGSQPVVLGRQTEVRQTFSFPERITKPAWSVD